MDGSQRVHITATAPGFAEASVGLTIQDNETASLSVELPARVREGDGSVPGILRLSAPPAADLAVTLFSSDTSEIQVPACVIVPAGQTAASFTATVVDDLEIDGPQTALVSAWVANWATGQAVVVVEDNDPCQLTLSLPVLAMQNQGLMPSAGQVGLAGSLPTNLVVSLVSSDPSQLTVPAVATIPAGQLSGRFDLHPLNGLWSGFITFAEPGQDVHLVVDDSLQHAATNTLFSLDASNSLRVQCLNWSAGELRLLFPSVIGKFYQIEQTPSLRNPDWRSLGPVLSGMGGVQAWSVPISLAQPAAFFRVVCRTNGS